MCAFLFHLVANLNKIHFQGWKSGNKSMIGKILGFKISILLRNHDEAEAIRRRIINQYAEIYVNTNKNTWQQRSKSETVTSIMC